MNENILKNIWIDLNIFDEQSTGIVSAKGTTEDLDSAYVIWQEANNTIELSDGNTEKLNQGFLSLKRAFNVASLELKKKIAIDKIKHSLKEKPNDFLGDLEYFQITKTLTLNKYLKLRNLIEHDNESPPSKEDCLSLSEYIWNYIRNVANILSNFIDHIEFNIGKSQNNKMVFNYEIEEKNKMYFPHLYLYGLLETDYISFVTRENSVKIDNIKLLNKFELEKIYEFKNDSVCVDNLFVLAFQGEIIDQDILARYVKCLMLTEYGGLDEETIKSVFREVC